MIHISSVPNNIYSLSQLSQIITNYPESWRPLVLTNGCFDLIHAGHIRYLQTAKSKGQKLVVGLNSDRSVQIIKPPQPNQPTRPIIPQSQRAEVLAALKPVDGVIIFDEPTADHIITQLKPEIYIKGGDYTIDTLPETPTVQSYGGSIQFIKIEQPTSTTNIIKKILSLT